MWLQKSKFANWENTALPKTFVKLLLFSGHQVSHWADSAAQYDCILN